RDGGVPALGGESGGDPSRGFFLPPAGEVRRSRDGGGPQRRWRSCGGETCGRSLAARDCSFFPEGDVDSSPPPALATMRVGRGDPGRPHTSRTGFHMGVLTIIVIILHVGVSLALIALI